MKNIFKFLFKHKLAMVGIILLLILQAYCDLSLPSLTSDVLNYGLQQGGIEDAVPNTIRESELDTLKIFAKAEDEEFIEASYEQADSNGIRALKDDVDREKLNDAVVLPECVIYQLNNDEAIDYHKEEGDIDMAPSVDSIVLMVKLGMLSKEDLQTSITQMMGQFGDFSDSILDQMAVMYVSAEYAGQGLDLEEIRNDYLWKSGAKMLLMSLVMTVAAIFIGLLASKTSSKIGMELRSGIYTKVMSFTDAEMEKFSTASLITRSTNDIQQIQFVSVMLLRMVLYSPILAIGGIIKVSQTKTGMSWIIVLAVCVLAALVGILIAIAMPKFKKMQTLVDKLNLVSREILSGIMPIRAFSREKHEEQRFNDANTELYKTQLFTNRVMTFMMPIMMFVMNGISVLIVWIGANGVNDGQIQVGDLTAFITYTMVIVMSFLMIAMICIMLPRAGVAADRIVEVLKTDVVLKDPADDKKRDDELKNAKGVLAFNNVSFAYPGADEPAISGITFTAEPSKTTAIIGSTGCGKSTLVKLIPRFSDVTTGSITIDGIDIRDVSAHTLREQIGYVPQKGVLFSGTIESNIKYAGDSVSDDDMHEAASIAQAEDFIESKEDKYDSAIAQGGTNVSGGQKQRLSIARAIAKKPKIFVFDDSFSALDYKTDLKLRRALSEKTADATVVIVAQRISTILHADNIIVLDEGQMVGQGTHSELMQSCDVYKQIASSQLSEAELKASSTNSMKGGNDNV